MININANDVEKLLTFPELIPALNNAFASDTNVPPRSHFDIKNPEAARETTLLIMPAWRDGDVAGVKLVTVAPENAKKGLPSIQGTYLLFDVKTGGLKTIIDAPSLTAKRTAAASALASQFLSRENSQTLMVIGTGTLAPQLIQAHIATRPIQRVMVWGRNRAKAQHVCDQVSHLGINCIAVDSIEHNIAQADIVSCATLSEMPLIKGQWLVPGQHLDMIGAYRPDMREMDDDCLTRSRVFVDNMESALRETGDLAIPLSKGVITADDIKADLFSLSRQEFYFERNDSDITIFKSVGHALEDLAAASLVTECFTKREN